MGTRPSTSEPLVLLCLWAQDVTILGASYDFTAVGLQQHFCPSLSGLFPFSQPALQELALLLCNTCSLADLPPCYLFETQLRARK